MAQALETNLDRIRQLAEERDDENWDFRSFLKGCDDEEVDSIVHRLYEEMAPRIDCKACANCCTVITPRMDKENVERLAQCTGMSASEFEAQYLEKSEEHAELVFKAGPCPLLKDGLCMHYEQRPESCASYPHLHKGGFVFRLILIVNSCAVCPIVFNVYEALKDELGFRR